MSKVVNCPKCGARCKTATDKESGEMIYSALQDEDAFHKIQQLKKRVQELTEQLKGRDVS